jgi:hypothetical protein
MSLLLRLILMAIRRLFTSRSRLIVEILALRQQLARYERERPKSTPTDPDRAFWVAIRDQPDTWAEALVIVKPSTVTVLVEDQRVGQRADLEQPMRQSVELRARPETSSPSTIPARPMPTSPTSFWKPSRSALDAPDLPRSGSTT